MPDVNLQPTLTGPRLIIRPIDQEDFEQMFDVASDPDVWALHPAKDRYQEPVFRAFFDDAIASGSGFSIIDKQSGAIIGSSRYNGYDPDKREIEIGWTFLGKAYWGGALNREMKQLMLAHAFDFVDTVVFWVGAENWRSRRAMEKIGGKLRPGLFGRDNGPADHVIYEMTPAQLPL